MIDIWVMADVPELVWEMLRRARELATERGGRVWAFVNGDEVVGRETVLRGADQVYLMPRPDGRLWEDYAGPLAEMAEREKPWLIMVGADRRGRDLAGQMAARLDAVCVSDCISVDVEDDRLAASRLVYGGLAIKTLAVGTFPALLTFGPRTFEPRSSDAARQGTIHSLAPPEESAAYVTARLPAADQAVNLGEAERVVGVGRGFAEKEELSLARDLAAALKAEIACSRPIAEFFKWLPESQYLGISGQVIKPQLYLAVGVSGQVQHVYGTRDARVVVAVNKDENAPMMEMSDYYIVGDLHEVLPLLTEALREAAGGDSNERG